MRDDSLMTRSMRITYSVVGLGFSLFSIYSAVVIDDIVYYAGGVLGVIGGFMLLASGLEVDLELFNTKIESRGIGAAGLFLASIYSIVTGAYSWLYVGPAPVSDLMLLAAGVFTLVVSIVEYNRLKRVYPIT